MKDNDARIMVNFCCRPSAAGHLSNPSGMARAKALRKMRRQWLANLGL